MAAGEQAAQRQAQGALLAEDDPLQLLEHLIDVFGHAVSGAARMAAILRAMAAISRREG
jgi:hypothetical protein